MSGVLIIEDHEDSADLLREIIEMLFSDVQVEVAYSGASGIERAAHFRPAIVLCDLELPDMDGYAVARSLRANVALSGARLVAYSGFSNEKDRTRSREAGFDLHLTKPVEPEILERLVADTRQSSTAPLDRPGPRLPVPTLPSRPPPTFPPRPPAPLVRRRRRRSTTAGSDGSDCWRPRISGISSALSR